MAVIWVPDGEPFEVEWYTSEGRAVGVQSLTTGFMRHEIAPTRTGFGYDVWRDIARTDAELRREFERRRHEPPRDRP